MKPFLERLNELGYREGDNMIFDYRSAEGASERLPQLAADAVRAHPDVLVMELAARLRLPAMYILRDFPEVGGLMYYGIDLRHMNRRAAEYVDKILKGAKPTDLPVEQPTKFELVINLKTAKALGLAVPDNLLARADEVIE
jgi:ABC-type uncharacterized transport system substrate-binding protein